MQVFYVGGRKANERKDYHLEEGEELFYMRQGDMCLKILEGGKFRYLPFYRKLCGNLNLPHHIFSTKQQNELYSEVWLTIF